MSSFFQVIKDWLPSLAVIVGGGWLLLRWIFDERLRARREMPAIDGELKTRILPLNHGRALLVLEANWKNSSPLPIFIDTKKTLFGGGTAGSAAPSCVFGVSKRSRH